MAARKASDHKDFHTSQWLMASSTGLIWRAKGNLQSLPFEVWFQGEDSASWIIECAIELLLIGGREGLDASPGAPRRRDLFT